MVGKQFLHFSLRLYSSAGVVSGTVTCAAAALLHSLVEAIYVDQVQELTQLHLVATTYNLIPQVHHIIAAFVKVLLIATHVLVIRMHELRSLLFLGLPFSSFRFQRSLLRFMFLPAGLTNTVQVAVKEKRTQEKCRN